MRVDLPAPFSPSRAWISPARAVNVTPLSASTPSKLFHTSASRSTSTSSAVTAIARTPVVVPVLSCPCCHSRVVTAGFGPGRGGRRPPAPRRPLARRVEARDDALERRLLLGGGEAARHDRGRRQRVVALRLARAARHRVLEVLLGDDRGRRDGPLGGQRDG